MRLIALTAIALLAAPVAALACSCIALAPPTLEEFKARGGMAVLGRVLSREKTGGADINAGVLLYEIKIEASINLPTAGTIVLRSAPNSAMCGVTLDVGTTQVLVVGKRQSDHWVGLCGNTMRARTADEARKWWADFLNGGTLPPRRRQ